MENLVLESTNFVVKNSKYVKINEIKINEFCKSFGESHINHWLSESPFDFSKLSKKDKLHFLLVFNAISFSYWGTPKWSVEYEGERFDGAWGMIVSIGKAFENGELILNSSYLKDISPEQLQKILKGNVEIPLFNERLSILREIGDVLERYFHGDFSELLHKSENDSQKLLQLILDFFPSFRDNSFYKRRVIHFNKRAQLLVADISQMFPGEISNLNKITACADYKLPMVLRNFGILEYSKELSGKVDKKIQILKDSDEEIEIRANTIWAVELIREELKKKIPRITSIHINDHLWLLGQIKNQSEKPYHLTRTTSY